MGMIKGIPVILVEKAKTGVDGFNQPVYEETEVTVENVLVAPSSQGDVITSTDLTGKKAIYTLGIPKTDTHEWENKKVRFFGKEWRVFGFSIQGIDENIPLDWNRKVMVERYE